MPAKVAINGFGRIGRNVLRAALESRDIEILAVNDLTDPATLAHLLKYDSVHGILQAEVSSSEGKIRVNDREIKVCSTTDPAELPWKELGIDIVIESTGRFTKGSDAARHIQAGAERVVISAPGKEVDATFCMGVNEQDYDPARHRIVSNASCTTNCLAPVAKVLNEQFGIRRGMMTTIHSYTNDQKILDLPHKDLRRARAAAISMIPTTTGAAKAVALVLPEMEGKLTGMAVRVPTPNVSLVDLVIETERATSVAEVNEVMRQAATGPLKGILDYNELPLVSHDLNGSSASSTIDALSTNVLDGNMVKVLSWYDNEWGYSNRVLDLVKFIAAR
ncbi:type I glyceraldehyde-3-phosphate dehydrogenase [Geothermobacter hydrogeniphilus]|uniref:Glyceraldehyde-3-phosphate dehydrogenase n=1 Tax=Geothermobacter hydrogeniphilus TaxID=1969733 RepID=A0A2K2H789_9BACT|nr:type I glyceraldehyde-3-phosphate dehydrogenase [Geothermobacter hydrogeniphilus]PNU19168.1 type I glyceraldehyde-3-phosphate dehydrogenase [Geothermobacter hydrogeniphilus]